MDVIQIRGLRAEGTHGVLPEEQVHAQPFELDLDIEMDLRGAARSDDLNDTLDYGQIAAIAVDVIEKEHHRLLERIAERIADRVLEGGKAKSVTVTLRKLEPMVPMQVASMGVQVVRH